jgi:hypothetical protein
MSGRKGGAYEAYVQYKFVSDWWRILTCKAGIPNPRAGKTSGGKPIGKFIVNDPRPGILEKRNWAMMSRILNPPFGADSGAEDMIMNCCEVVVPSVGDLAGGGIVALCFKPIRGWERPLGPVTGQSTFSVTGQLPLFLIGK